MTIDVLVIGGSGFVGGRVVQSAHAQGLTVAYTYTHHWKPWPAQAYPVDLTRDDGAVERCLDQTRPNAVIYCAVPQVGADEAAHEAVSVRGVERVARVLPPEARLVYVSSNAVFNSLNGPYREDSAYEERTDRHRAYGLTKARGEQAALLGHANTVVGRTAHVEGRDADGTLHWRLAEVIDRLKAGQPVPRFTDRQISPTWVQTLADALLEVARPDFSYRGILHLAGATTLTDYTYTRLLARALGVDEEQVRPDRMLPEGSQQKISLGLDCAFSQSQLKTRLLGIDACAHEVLND